MDVVLGVSMSPSTIRMVRVEGENADCMTVEAHASEVASADEPVTAVVDRVVTAVLAAREGADEAGDQLCSTGVTWTDEVELAQLREALADRNVENVMLISAFLAAAALAQAVGQAIGDGRIAMLFVEPECATLAVVDAADGSITDVHKELMHSADATDELIEMVAGFQSLETCPAGLFVVGSGVDTAPIKSRLETETSLMVITPEEPEAALARGAALASANAPLFASSTAALAYAQDPGTGEVDLDAVAPGHFYVPDAPSGGEPGEEELAYSAVPDEEADALTEVIDSAAGDGPNVRRRRPVLLLGSAGAVVAISAALAMEVALALGIRPGVALRPSPGHNLIVPTEQAPAPAQQPRNISHPGPVAVPHPLNPPAAPAPPPAAAVPAPIPAAPPVPVPVAPPAMPAPDSPPAPLNLPAPQPQMQVPAAPPTQIPAAPPTHVPVSPPTHVPVSHPPVHVPVPPPPAHVPEPQPPVNSPSPDAPPAPGHPGHEAPPVPGLPGLEPPSAPGLPGHEAPPAPDTPPARGDEGGPGAGPGGEVGGHGSGGGVNEGGAGTDSHGSSGGGEIGGSTGGSSSSGSSSSGSSSSGGAEIGGGSSSGSSSSGVSSSGGSEIGGSSSAGSSSGESGGGGHH